MLSNCGVDEKGGFRGGKAGDQGGEWMLRKWYSHPWDTMLRYPVPDVRHWMGDTARAAALNDHIGYDQGERMSFWYAMQRYGYDASAIAIDCEADCSSGVLAIAKSAGYKFGIAELKSINNWGYTGNETQILAAAGFEVHREAMYLTTSNYLDNGDILLNTTHHTAFNVDRGALYGEDRPANVPSKARNDAGMRYRVHVQKYGWLPSVHDGQIAGTVGESKRVEALKITPPEGVVLDVDVHMQTYGWRTYTGIRKGASSGTGSSDNDPIIGTTGLAKRLEAIRIRCAENKTGRKLKYQVHVQTYGWMDAVDEGETAGTTGKAKRMEAIRIWFE